MYSTCLFCQKSLGANEVIEHLPVGRRLAFDSATGRLWVVCAACRRWNLTPIEERWEAIEACERLYRGARVRASTDQIGLARLPEGLELVRIGSPPRAELASWQYVDVFRRRRQRALIMTGLGAVAMVGLGVGWATIVGAGVLVQVGVQLTVNLGKGLASKVVGPRGEKIIVTHDLLPNLWWVPPRAEEPFGLKLARESLWKGTSYTDFRGDVAHRALRPILAHANRFAGRPEQVRLAVDKLNRKGDPLAVGHTHFGYKQISFHEITVVDRLALEMALAERDEQKLLAGELAGLTEAWRQAEEIAGIADNLFLPESVTAWIRRQKRKDA